MMPACGHIKLLLGPFDDGELEPHEMEDVALHVVICTACKAALDDYRSLGVALRGYSPEPALEGFGRAVIRRIDEIPQPLWIRCRNHLSLFAERPRHASLVAGGAFAALLAALLLLTPYRQSLLGYPSHLVQLVFSDKTTSSSDQSEIAENGSSDQLEPMIALSNDPTTTVIWLPNQP
jgi:hypothetical protein